MRQKIRNFTDLTAWKEGHQLVLDLYRVTKVFTDDEKFGLTSQIRRAAVSITSNLAEGFSRRSSKEKIQFYYLAKGSLTEVQNQLLIARDIGYLQKKDFTLLANQTVTVGKLMTGLIKVLQK